MTGMPKKIYTSETFSARLGPEGREMELATYVRADIVQKVVTALQGFMALPNAVIDEVWLGNIHAYVEAARAAEQALAFLNGATVEANKQEDENADA